MMITLMTPVPSPRDLVASGNVTLTVLKMIFRRGGNVGPEDYDTMMIVLVTIIVMIMKSQWSSGEVEMLVPRKRPSAANRANGPILRLSLHQLAHFNRLLNFGYQHWKLLIPARAMAVIKVTMIMITELPLRCSGDDPWHVQHFALCATYHRLWCRIYSSGTSLYPQTINSIKKDPCNHLILHKRVSAL